METGLGMLRLSPETFWKLTVRERAMFCTGQVVGSAHAPLGRAELETLLERFPDS
jgi:uncharacterized phage protein (TIGR02216 family)